MPEANCNIYIAGGILPKIARIFARSTFRQRFESKGRMRGYLASIRPCLISHKGPAFVGAAKLLDGA